MENSPGNRQKKNSPGRQQAKLHRFGEKRLIRAAQLCRCRSAWGTDGRERERFVRAAAHRTPDSRRSNFLRQGWTGQRKVRHQNGKIEVDLPQK